MLALPTVGVRCRPASHRPGCSPAGTASCESCWASLAACPTAAARACDGSRTDPAALHIWPAGIPSGAPSRPEGSRMRSANWSGTPARNQLRTRARNPLIPQHCSTVYGPLTTPRWPPNCAAGGYGLRIRLLTSALYDRTCASMAAGRYMGQHGKLTVRRAIQHSVNGKCGLSQARDGS